MRNFKEFCLGRGIFLKLSSEEFLIPEENLNSVEF
jgi:hypothetical protein